MNSLIVGCIDEVSAGLIKSVKQLEAGFLIHSSHPVLIPLVTNAHGTETDGRDVDAGERRELAVATELGRWLRSGGEDRHCARGLVQ